MAEREEVYHSRQQELLCEFDEVVEELFFLSVEKNELIERMDELEKEGNRLDRSETVTKSI